MPMVVMCTPWPGKVLQGGAMIHDTMSPLPSRYRQAMLQPCNFSIAERFQDCCEVDDARNQVARACLDKKPQPDFLFFLDWDVLPPQHTLTRLWYHVRTRTEADIYAGVYCSKFTDPPDPLIFQQPGAGPFWDWTAGDVLTTEQHGIYFMPMGLTLIRVSLFQRMLDAGLVHGDGCDLDDEPWFKTVRTHEATDGGTLKVFQTEDSYFADKAKKVGCKIVVDTGIIAGHLDKNTGIIYHLPSDQGPIKRGRERFMSQGKQSKPEEYDPAIHRAYMEDGRTMAPLVKIVDDRQMVVGYTEIKS